MYVKSLKEIEADTCKHDMEFQLIVDVLDRKEPVKDYGVVDTILVRAKFEKSEWVCCGNYEHIDYGDRIDAKDNPHLSIVGARVHPDFITVVG